MARPQKEGMEYFPHDTDASSDEKVEALRSLFGNDGYAFYFIMLERIYRTPNAELNISDAETKEETLQILSRKVGVTPDLFGQMLSTSLKWGCFDKQIYDERGVLTSQGIKKRAAAVLERREKSRKSYIEQKVRVSDAETHTETHTETGVSAEFRLRAKVKESKEKKREIKDSSTTITAAAMAPIFEKEFGRLLSPIELECLSDLGETPNELVLEALKVAVAKGALSFKFISSILADWQHRGLRTLREIKDYEKEFNEKRREARNRGTSTVQPEAGQQKLKKYAPHIPGNT